MTLTLPIRKSAESVHQMSISRSKKKKQVKNERSQSFSFESSSSYRQTTTTTQKQQQIYPALLSKVAFAFKDNMVVGSKLKDSIQYHNVFDGRDAVVMYSILLIYLYPILISLSSHDRINWRLSSKPRIGIWRFWLDGLWITRNSFTMSTMSIDYVIQPKNCISLKRSSKIKDQRGSYQQIPRI